MKSDTSIVGYLVGNLVESNPGREASRSEDDHGDENICT